MSYNDDLKNSLKIFAINDENFDNISLEILKKEYHKKAKQCHPDKTHKNESGKFQELQNAYEFLVLHKMMHMKTQKNNYETNVENFYDFVQHMKMFKNKETFRNWLTYWDTKLKFIITMLCKNPKNYIMLQMWFQLLQQYNYIDYLPESLLNHIKMQLQNMSWTLNDNSNSNTHTCETNDSSDSTEQSNQLNQTNETNQTNQTNESNQTNETNETTQIKEDIKISRFQKPKTKLEHYLRLEASFTDLMEQNIYKLDYQNNVLFIPLWHQELEYDITIEDVDTKEKTKAELKIEIIHKMPQRAALDKDNNLHVFYKLPIKESILSSDKLTIYLENYKFTLLNKDIKLLRKQTLLNPNSGPPKINPNNLYSGDRAHIYFYIELLAS